MLPEMPAGAVLPYEFSGGEDSPRPWRVAGFFVEPKDEGRVVWELTTWSHRALALLDGLPRGRCGRGRFRG
jgi:hypothetical protein